MKKLYTFLAMAAVAPAVCALPDDIRLNPVPGSTMEQIAEFTVNSGWLELKNNANTTDVLINGHSCHATITADNYDALRFTLDAPVTAAGTYSLIIKGGTFLMGFEGDDNPLIEWEYIVENDNAGGDGPGADDVQNEIPDGYVFKPAAGSSVPVLTSFSVTASADYFLTPATRQPRVKINGKTVNTVTSVSGDMHNVLTWTLAEPIAEPGTYIIYIPAGTFFGYKEVDNEPFVVTVKVTGGEVPAPDYYKGEISADPAAGSAVASLQRIAVMSPKLTSLYLGPEAYGMTVTDEVGATVPAGYTLTPDPDDFNDPHVVWLELDTPLTAPGRYTLEFPACAFEVAKYPDVWYTGPFELDFIVGDGAGVEDAMAAPGTTPEYYNLQGVRVAAPATGIYIRRTASGAEKVSVK